MRRSLAVLKQLRRLAQLEAGVTAVTFAMVLPVLLGVAGLAVDVAVFSLKKAELQSAADHSAIAAANELLVGNTDEKTVQATAAAYTAAALDIEDRTIDQNTVLGNENTSVMVSLNENWTPFFVHFVGVDVTPISVKATALLAGETRICVLATNPIGIGAVSMKHTSYLQATGCSVFSNSINPLGVYLGDDSIIEAKLVCSAGGVLDFGSPTASQVKKDCPPIADPLKGRPPPKVGVCDYYSKSVKSGTVSLGPGVYCGGIDISGSAKVTFKPGNYVIKDGPFQIRQKAKVKGKDVAFYLTGLLSTLSFRDGATIELSGAETGSMAGLLFFEDPKSVLLRNHTVSASNAHVLTGTIYLPAGSLFVDPNSSVGEDSAYTAIVARRLIVENGPRLVLNTDYASTKVPVPEGIVTSAQVVLTE